LAERCERLLLLKSFIKDEYQSLRDLDRWVEQWLPYSNPSTLMNDLSSAPATPSTILKLRKSALQLVDECLQARAKEIPLLETWQRESKKGISFYVSRSKATKQLDAALDLCRTGISATLEPSTEPDDPEEKLHAKFIELHLMGVHLQALLLASEEWAKGRNPSSSRRMPHVLGLLEWPTRRELINIAMVSESVKTKLHLANLLEHEVLLDEAIQAYELHTQLIAREDAATKLVQSAWRSNRAKTLGARYKKINTGFSEYLEATHNEFQDEALALGRQKELAPGQNMPVTEVEWKDPNSAAASTSSGSDTTA